MLVISRLVTFQPASFSADSTASSLCRYALVACMQCNSQYSSYLSSRHQLHRTFIAVTKASKAHVCGSNRLNQPALCLLASLV